MAQRGRKSAASLALANAERHLVQRPSPPADLTSIQRLYWVEIANSLPADWFRDDNKQLLGEYCRTLSTLAFMNSQIDELEASKEIDVEFYLKLVQRRESLARTQLSQATKMRLTQQSRYRADKAAVETRSPKASGKTWHFEG